MEGGPVAATVAAPRIPARAQERRVPSGPANAAKSNDGQPAVAGPPPPTRGKGNWGNMKLKGKCMELFHVVNENIDDY